MFETYYRRKPLTTKAVQYDGTKEMAEDLMNEYFHLNIYGSSLYFSLYYDEEELISNGDWLLIDEGNHVFEVVDKDSFDDMYEEVDGEAWIICPECNCNKTFYNPIEEENQCPCGYVWAD